MSLASAVVVLAAVLFAAHYALTPVPSTHAHIRPIVALHNYANAHPATQEVLPPGDMLIEEQTVTAQASCAAATNLDDLKEAMRLKLSDLHPQLLQRILTRAFIAGLAENRDKLKHAEVSTGRTGEASFSIARWDTVQVAGGFESCVTAGSYRIQAADALVGVNQTRSMRKIGEEVACKLSIGRVRIGCRRVPVFEEAEDTTPVFRKNLLSANAIADLTSFMEAQCVDAARKLAVSEGDVSRLE